MRERSQHFDPRQTMRTDTFEVFHYRQSRPAGVEVHHHDFYEVYLLLAGHVEYWVDGRILPMTPGDVLLINPMELHRPLIGPEGKHYERIVIWIHKRYLEGLDADGGLSRCFDPTLPTHTNLLRPTASERSVLVARMGELVREFYSTEHASKQAAMGLFLQVMVQLNRMALGAEHETPAQSQTSRLVRQVLEYISENPESRMSLEELAERFYVSKYHLSHTFSREVGISVYRYILLRRLLLARQLLASGESATDVCQSCGFSDYTGFYRAFKSEYGISPRQYAAQREEK